MTTLSIQQIVPFSSFPLEEKDIKEIQELIQNDVSLFHLSKINFPQAVEEAFFYLYPDY
jgi:hypothetical protein